MWRGWYTHTHTHTYIYIERERGGKGGEKELTESHTDLLITNFYFLKLSENFAEKQVTISFLVNKDLSERTYFYNISNILGMKQSSNCLLKIKRHIL